MPPFELLSSAAAKGNWSTKEDLVELRKIQEADALKDLTGLIKDHNAGTRGSRTIQESTKEVIDGLMTRTKRHFIVFNTREIQIALLAFRHHLNHNTTPSTHLSIFVKSTLEIYCTEEAKKAAKKLESKRHKRKDPSEAFNAAEFEKEVAKAYYDKAALVKLSNAMNAARGGTFHFEFGCAVFYPQPSDAVSKLPKDATPARERQVKEPAAENHIEKTPMEVTRNTIQTDFSRDIAQLDLHIMQFDLRLSRIEAQMGVQDDNPPIGYPSLIDRVAILENEISTMRSTTVMPEEAPEEPQFPDRPFEADLMDFLYQ